MTSAGASSDGADGTESGAETRVGEPGSRDDDVSAGAVSRRATRLAAAQIPSRVEMGLLAFFSGAWAFAALLGFGVLPGTGALSLDLYSLYGLAAALGWVAGNVYVVRRRALGRSGLDVRRGRLHLLLVYLLGPPSVIYVLRALAPLSVQNAAPFVPLYAFAVYGIFFLVPVTLK